jgi:hypothetical protein
MDKNIQILPIQVTNPYTTKTEDKELFFINKKTSIRPSDVDYVRLPNGKYSSLDPRIFNSPHSQRLELNRPPLVSSFTQPQTNIYTDNGNQTGYYKDYESIKGGNIKYYTDLLFGAPYGVINFSSPSYTIPQILIDPMGSVKPYYQRVPIMNQNTSLYEYTFDRDTCSFREDIMATQRQVALKSGWRPYQFFNNPEKYYPMYDYPTKGHFPWTQDVRKNN